MTANADPWRTLGLNPGASLDEIRRAYRRLAKANHPDTAGETAVPRFLAIQAAYEQLAGPATRRRPGSRPGRTSTPPTEPWRADPDRARASGRADGRRPGARPTSTRGPGVGTPGADGTAGAAGAAGKAGTTDGSAPGATRARRTGRRRAPNKATPYSTSYDAADEEPFEPGWSGATWYGASSGTYWTINPKEYADPRKHGPEYQRRARRGGTGWILDDAPDDAPAAEAPPAEPTWTDARAGAPSGEPAGAEAAGGATARAGTAWAEAEGTRETDVRSGDPPAGDGAPPRPPRTWVEEPPPGPRFRGPVLRIPSSATGRLAMALIAWPPLALLATITIGEETGCGRFAASCSELSSPGTWIVEAAILILLVALPRLATWAAHGTVATVIVGVPAAILLSATGGSRQPEASAAVLAWVIGLAWVAGIAYAVLIPRLWGSGPAYHGPDESPSRRP